MSLSKATVSALVTRSLEQLDLPNAIADEAIEAYELVGSWLCADDSPLVKLNPALYPQGSFRLGTPVRPLVGDDFDIDLVCELSIAKESVTQADLKKRVGDRLRDNSDLKKRLSERRRCWTLSFAPHFHLDVLPCIHDAEKRDNSILLTDRELRHWQHSNPKGYAAWFANQMKPLLLEERQLLAKSLNVEIEEVPEWSVRTPLQRAVQFLKRHRDLRFRARAELRPVSIIVTTLAAQAYARQPDLATTISHLATTMASKVERRGGKWWVANPAHLDENFADKWNETPALVAAFKEWLLAVAEDLSGIEGSLEERAGSERLSKSLAIGSSKPAIALRSPQIPKAGDVSHAKPPIWPSKLMYTCNVDTTIHAKKYSGASISPLVSHVRKGRALRFAASTNAPAPYVVQWQVVNTGQEARSMNGLRGGFDAGEGQNGAVRWEDTSYTGTHFMQAFVVKDGMLVARSDRVAVPIG